jgi:hypothetical protein
VVDIVHSYKRDGDCDSMHYVLCAVVQTFFYFLFFYGCEVQGFISTLCMATEKLMCFPLLIGSLFTYMANL